MRKIFRKVHLWLSVPFGLIITIVCFSGAMLVFEDEISEAVQGDLYFVDRAEGEPMDVGELMAKVAQELPDSVQITSVSISPDPERAWQVNLSKPRRAALLVDQYTGEIKGKAERLAFFATMFRLHRWLLDTMKPGSGGSSAGKTVVGIATLACVFILVSGIAIWWPRSKKALKNSLKISVRRGAPRFAHDLHVAGGVYVAIFLLVMALTGLTWSFPWYRSAFYAAFGVEMKQQSQGREQGRERTQGEAPRRGGQRPEGAHWERRGGERTMGEPRRRRNPYRHWNKIYEQLRADNPGFKRITVGDGEASVQFNNLGNQRASDKYEFDRRRGELTGATPYAEAAPSGKMRGWIFSVHAGTWGGLLTRILWFLTSLIGATLPLTGYYLWIKRLRRKPKPQPQAQAKPA